MVRSAPIWYPRPQSLLTLIGVHVDACSVDDEDDDHVRVHLSISTGSAAMRSVVLDVHGVFLPRTARRPQVPWVLASGGAAPFGPLCSCAVLVAARLCYYVRICFVTCYVAVMSVYCRGCRPFRCFWRGASWMTLTWRCHAGSRATRSRLKVGGDWLVMFAFVRIPPWRGFLIHFALCPGCVFLWVSVWNSTCAALRTRADERPKVSREKNRETSQKKRHRELLHFYSTKQSLS